MVNFPTLESITRAANHIFKQYKEKKIALTETERYNSNESERKYQLDLLESELTNDMKTFKAKYAEEIDNLIDEAATASLTHVIDDDPTIAKLIDHTVNELSYSDDKNRILELLAYKIRVMNDTQKLTVLRQFGQISKAVSDDDNLDGMLSGLKSHLKLALPKHELQLMQLKQLRTHGNPTAAYDTYHIVTKGIKSL